MPMATPSAETQDRKKKTAPMMLSACFLNCFSVIFFLYNENVHGCRRCHFLFCCCCKHRSGFLDCFDFSRAHPVLGIVLPYESKQICYKNGRNRVKRAIVGLIIGTNILYLPSYFFLHPMS